MKFNMFMPNEEEKKLILTALETIDISRQSYYYKNEKLIQLKTKSRNSFNNAIVYSTDLTEKLDFGSTFRGLNECTIQVMDCDSIEAALKLNMPLVMNFANPYRPGGGFFYGAKAQEESLCRSSTLYLSLSSEAADEMYSYNNQHKSSVNSDYMILSPDVCVFRNSKYELLDEPYYVSVISVSAPESCDIVLPKSELEEIMKKRIRNMLNVASKHGYRSLVLGAWGCGAFGNDANSVASCFYDVLINQNYSYWFDNIIFAILSDKEKLEVFQKQFNAI